jgi:hypothetical protein
MTALLPRPTLPKVVEAISVKTVEADLVDKTIVLKALNQLISLVSGGRIARVTDHLKETPLKRCLAAWKVVLNEAERTSEEMLTDAANMRRMQGTATKIESLSSLIALAKLFEETEW